MAKTKIVVLQMKEIIYTAIFVGLGILLVILLIFMFVPDKEKSGETTKYKPGVYTTSLTLSDATLNLEIVVDASSVKSVRLVNLDESVATMYPLVEPTVDDIETQLVNGTAIDDIPIPESSKYTQTLITDAIRTTLTKASVESKN